MTVGPERLLDHVLRGGQIADQQQGQAKQLLVVCDVQSGEVVKLLALRHDHHRQPAPGARRVERFRL
jgi:hypothetical protein